MICTNKIIRLCESAKEGYVHVEPRITLYSLPDVYGNIRVHNLWTSDSEVLVLDGDQKLFSKRVINPKWVKKMFREYPPLVLMYSLITIIFIPDILQTRYDFDNVKDRREATEKKAEEIVRDLEKKGIRAELSDLVVDLRYKNNESLVSYKDIFEKNPEIRNMF